MKRLFAIFVFAIMCISQVNQCVAAMTVTDPGAYARFADQLKQLQTMQSELAKLNQAMKSPYQSNINEIIEMQKNLNNIYGNYDSIGKNWNDIFGQDYSNMNAQQMLDQGNRALKASQQTILNAAQAQGIVFEQGMSSNQKLQQLQQSNWAGNLTPLAAQQLTNQALVELSVSMNTANRANAEYQNAMLSNIQKQEDDQKRVNEQLKRAMSTRDPKA